MRFSLAMANVYILSLALLILCVLELSYAQGNYAYIGCYWDDQVRALPDLTSCGSPCITVCSASMPYCQTGSMTVDTCVDLCKSKQFKYAGLQAGTQCFCGSTSATFSQHGQGSSCTMPCVGNSSQVCGDVYRNSVYDTLYQQLTCLQPGTIAKGSISTGEKSEYFENDSITYICDEMTFMLGVATRTCLSSGEWNNPPPECRTVCTELLPSVESNRGAPVPVEEYISSVNVEGEVYLLPCVIGYTSSSESILATCQSDGIWNYNSTDTVCEAVVCAVPVLGEGVVVIGNDFTYSSTITFTCVEGYTTSSGSAMWECQSDGTWSGMNISCSVVTCPIPQIPDGLVVTPGPYSFGNIVTYFCRGEGSILIGNSTRMCTGNGSWSGQSPVCQITVPTTIPNPTTQVTTFASRTTMPIINTFATTRFPTQHPATTNAATQRPTTMRVPSTMQPPTMKSVTTRSTTRQETATEQKTTGQQRETSIITETVTYRRVTDDSQATTLPTIIKSSPDVTSSIEASPSPSKQSTTSEGINEKAKSGKSPADFMVLIVIGAGIFSVLFLSIIFTVACVKSPKRGKAHLSKSINFISSKETGSMMDILWPEDLTHDSPRSRADSGLPPSDRNSPASNDEYPDGGGVVNMAFENDEVYRRREEDPYHLIDFVVVNESNGVNSVLVNSGIMSPAPQTQDDRSSISHSRMNSFQQADDVESLYAKVDMSKKSKKGVDRTQSTLSDYKSEENPLYEQTRTPKLVLPADDNQSVGNGVVRKTSRRTPSDVSVSSPSYWAQYEEQVTRL